MFRYFKELYLEIKIWRRIKKIAKESEKTLNENNFRVDWVGRIYTVINLIILRLLYSVVVNHSEKISNLWDSLKNLL